MMLLLLSSGGYGANGSNVFFAYIFAQVHQMIIQQWRAATTIRHSYTLAYQFLTDLQTFV